MINLWVNTRLEFKKAFDHTLKYFIRENSLILVELVAHLHGEEGATELRISGQKITGKEEYKSMDILMDYVEQKVKSFWHFFGLFSIKIFYWIEGWYNKVHNTDKCIIFIIST